MAELGQAVLRAAAHAALAFAHELEGKHASSNCEYIREHSDHAVLVSSAGSIMWGISETYSMRIYRFVSALLVRGYKETYGNSNDFPEPIMRL